MIEQKLIDLLKDELVVAMGCTEPLALAYAGSVARHYLNEFPEKIILKTSTNIFKNVRCVAIPNTGLYKGVEASALLGVFGGNHEKGFACIDGIGSSYDKEIKDFIDNKKIEVTYLHDIEKLYIHLTLVANDCVSIEIKENHLNITKVIKNEKVLFEKEELEEQLIKDNKELLKFENIYNFSNNVDLEKLKDVLDMQYKYNLAISNKGLKEDYGVSIGQTILKNHNNIWGKIKAYTAAGSEARMCGSMMPVIINSGSGNQGLSSSVPVIVYGKEKKISKERIYRALIFSNLLTLKQKKDIGALSAYCGIVSSCGSAGAGLTYLENGTYDQLVMTMKNYLASVPGIICDGAKASCASKIAVALDGAILSHQLAMNNKQYEDNTGILKEDIDKTIDIIADIANKGMKETDNKIIKHLI